MSSPFDLDDDEQALTRKRRPLGWFTAAALGIAFGAFTFSYYLPLQKAHTKLAVKYESIASKSQELDHALRGSKQALVATEEARSSLQRFIDQGSDEETALEVKLESARATAENQLAAFVKAKLVSLETGPSKLSIHVKQSLLFRPASTAPAPRAKPPLCKVAGLLAGDSSWRLLIRLPLDPEAKDPWLEASEKAANLAQLLEMSCKVAAHRVEIQARLDEDESSPELVFLDLGPAKAPALDLNSAPETKASTPDAANKAQ